jgi:hypothetical protein
MCRCKEARNMTHLKERRKFDERVYFNQGRYMGMSKGVLKHMNRRYRMRLIYVRQYQAK